MDRIAAYLPPGGLLPTWLVFLAVVSIGNSIQAYSSLAGTREVYAGKDSVSPVTELSARTFGTWTFISAIARLYSAYNLTDPRFYQIAMWTLGVACAHFFSEWLVFKTARLGKGLAGPIVISTGTLLWMLAQWSYYVKN